MRRFLVSPGTAAIRSFARPPERRQQLLLKLQYLGQL
jgi:hypothetical protein